MSNEADEAGLHFATPREAMAWVKAQRAVRTSEKKQARADREVHLAETTRIASETLGSKLYSVIYADPEWRFEPYSRETGMDRAADNHFPTSGLDVLKQRKVPAAGDCILFLWATSPMMPQALEAMQAWGFAYKSQCVWVKDRIGTGYWFRNKHEVLLVGVRGKPPAPAMGDQFPSVIEAPVREHSRKPDEFAKMIEAYYPTCDRLEMNARGPRAGWDVWGNEADAGS